LCCEQINIMQGFPEILKKKHMCKLLLWMGKCMNNLKNNLHGNSIINSLMENLGHVIKGKDEVLCDIILALLGGVNILIEDVPGVGKTTLARGLAKSVRGEFRRVQFTPDLLPADILGSSIYNPREGSFYFKKGPVFTNILLADEINRASPRTQSSLLEAMSEGQVTIEGVTYPLPDFFVVIATQNPVEFQGTYPLPEAQLDRFGVNLSIGYPVMNDEIEVFYSQNQKHPLDDLESVTDLADILKLREEVKKVEVSRLVAGYIVNLADASRRSPDLKLGISTRGSLMLYRMSQARAFMENRTFVLPDDVKSIALKVLSHRLVLDTKSKYSGITKKQIVEDILLKVPVPT
jgi:MoxR-like ATPase